MLYYFFLRGYRTLMMDSIVSLPFVWAFLILFVVVMLRSNATYWAGRGLAAGGRRTKMQKHLDSPGALRAEKVIARWGAPAVSVSFLTVGVQTAINMSAGLCRMPLRRYIPATVVGSIAWACIYATIGLAAFDAALAAAAGSPLALVLLVLAVGAVALGGHLLRVSRSRKLDQSALEDCPVMGVEVTGIPTAKA